MGRKFKIGLLIILLIICGGIYTVIFSSVYDGQISDSSSTKVEQNKEIFESNQIQFTKEFEGRSSNDLSNEDLINIGAVILIGTLILYIFFLIRKSRKKQN